MIDGPLQPARRQATGRYRATDVPAMAHLARQTLAVILAGGRGSRLGPLTDWHAKPAIPFGGKFRVIDFTLSNCLNSGIRRIGVATQYRAQSLIRHIQHGWSFLDPRFDEFIDLLPAQQRATADWYKGTADAVLQNLDMLQRHAARLILVLAGDHIYKMDYTRMLAEHVARCADMTVGCVEAPLAEATQMGVMEVDDDFRVIGFQEKPCQPRPLPGRTDIALASMGIYVFTAPFLYAQLLRDAEDPESSHDFGHDLIPYLVDGGYRVAAHLLDHSCPRSGEGKPYWRDVGTVDAYWEANMELTLASPALDLFDRSWPVWTCQEQLPPAKFTTDGDGRCGVAMDSLVSGGCVVKGSTIRNSLLFSKVYVHSGCSIDGAVLLPDVEVGRGAVLRRVVVDGGTRIPPGIEIGLDPAADRQRFHVTEKGVTLVTREALEALAGGLDIRPLSWPSPRATFPRNTAAGTAWADGGQ